MGFLDFFRRRQTGRLQTWKELGQYNAMFNTFGADAYNSDLVRSCIRPLATFTSKAECKCSDKKIAALLNGRPNIYMDGRSFLKKVRTRYELYNTCMVYIQRDDRAKPSGFYPVPYDSFEALEYNNGLFIRFRFKSGHDPLVIPWEDLAVIRKDYNKSDIAGDDNTAILDTLQMIQTTNEGLRNAIRATANLRGILKSTKAMLAPEAIKAQKDQFVKDYLSLENAGGIASLDATQEFTPITMSPTVASWEQAKELRENVYRYYGVNEKIITADMTPEEVEVFYEMCIEPFLVLLSSELQSKIFSDRELAFGASLVYEANKLQFASLSKKIQMYKEVVLYGGMTINEWRAGCNMSPLEDGDRTIMRLDAKKSDDYEEDEHDE